MRSEKNIEGVEYFLDDVIISNQIFLLTNKLKLICLEIKPAKSALIDQANLHETAYSGSSLVLEWQSELTNVTASSRYGLVYHEKVNKLYIVTEHQVIELDTLTKK